MKVDFRDLILSDYVLLRDFERVLGDSVEVIYFLLTMKAFHKKLDIYNTFLTLLLQLILKNELRRQKQEATQKYQNLCHKLKYAEVDLTSDNSMNDSGVTGD